MKNIHAGLLACTFAAFVSTQIAAPAAAQSPEDTFRGKTLRILIPTGPGGGRALYTLPFANAYGRHIPGNPAVTPVFMPGAGGSLALNNLYSVAEPDGLTIATTLVSVLNAQIIGEKSVKYDARKFKWLGRIDDATRVFVANKAVTAQTLDDLRKQEVVVGAVGMASDTATNALFLNRLFGTKFKVVAGYGASSKMMLAMMSGETHGAFTTWSNVHSNQAGPLRDGVIRPILQIGYTKHVDMPNVPLVLDLATTEEDKQLVRLMSTSTLMGQSYAAPPALPEPVLEILRRSFDATMKDPDFIAKMLGVGVKINPMTGEDLRKLVDQIMDTPQAIVERYKKLTSGE